MYTTSDPKDGVAALKIFEQVYSFFLQFDPSHQPDPTPARIVAFRSEREYLPYRLHDGAFAYYLRSHQLDYIVMQDISPAHHQAAVHEYTHLVLRRLGLTPPLWLNEGLADFYSSLEPRGNQILVGHTLPGRAALLMTQPWLDMETLVNVTTTSRYYTEPAKMPVFYAQSWALVHMLSLSNTYRAGFPQFLTAMSSGRSAADCFRSFYGKSLDQVQQDLRAYLLQPSVPATLLPLRAAPILNPPEVAPADGPGIQLALADLLAAQNGSGVEAAARLSALSTQYPENPAVAEAAAYLAWRQGDRTRACQFFQQAFEHGSTNTEMLVQYAGLLRAAGAPASQTLPLLERAVAIRPDFEHAWFDLGGIALIDHKWTVAAHALSQVKSVLPDRAYTLYSALAYCDLQLKRPGPARSMADLARPYAKTEAQVAQLAKLMTYLDWLDRSTADLQFTGQPLTDPALGSRKVPDRGFSTRHAPASLGADASYSSLAAPALAGLE